MGVWQYLILKFLVFSMLTGLYSTKFLENANHEKKLIQTKTVNSLPQTISVDKLVGNYYKIVNQIQWFHCSLTKSEEGLWLPLPRLGLVFTYGIEWRLDTSDIQSQQKITSVCSATAISLIFHEPKVSIQVFQCMKEG